MIFSLSGCQDQIDPRADRISGPGPDPDSPLIGTSWFYDAWGGAKLYFESAETVLLIIESIESRHGYSYDKATRKGHAVSLGNFTITENYEQMNFSPTWRGYPHGALFTRSF